MTRTNTGKEAGDGSVILSLSGPRPVSELRAAQRVIASYVYDDPRTEPGYEKEAWLMELLEALGLDRRFA